MNSVCSFMANQEKPNPLYHFPEYYDIIFARDVSVELEFLLGLFKLHRHRPLQSYLDLGCGPGYYARGMADRGIESIGLDCCQEMIDFARAAAAREQLRIDFRTGDMRNFEIDKPIDLAACLFDSIDGMLSLDDFVAHFRAVASNLRADGLYVIGQMHQRDTPIIGYGPFHYRAERDGKEVALDWATDVKIETLTQTADVSLELRVKENGQVKVMQHRTRESFITPPFLTAAARLSGVLEPFTWYGDYDLQQPYDDTENSIHCISIFRKTNPGREGEGDGNT
ncbi:MAG: class I SAM-dependent DNA methyltransferase [Geminicoccaceae bacterium]